jgi:formyl-CoA transferase/CoA:oxalate CoA-transferase
MTPLNDILVLDLSRVLAGPYCSMYLADMGAEVIKVERPGKGDDTRGYGPPFVAGESCYFTAINRGKKSIAIDLKHPEGIALVKDLAVKADIVLENFRPGTAAKLGLSYEDLSEDNPGLIYASISGFGHEGDPQYTTRPGYDLLAQGLSGIQHLTGSAAGPPTRVGVAIGDLVGGIYTLTGIMTALLVRSRTGKGQKVDISLLDSLVSLLSYQAGMALNGDKKPHRMGNAHPTICPYDTFLAADGYINIACGNDTLFDKLIILLELEALGKDSRFETNALRVENRSTLYEILTPLIARFTVQEWEKMLFESGIPGGPILDLTESLSHPQILAREMVLEVNHPQTGPLKVTGFPIKLSETKGGPQGPSPLLGEHTLEILKTHLELSDNQLERLQDSGAIETVRS